MFISGGEALRKNLRSILVVVLGILLNVSGAVLAGFLAINLGFSISVILLVTCLGTVYLGRIWYWVAVSRRYQLSYIYPLLSVGYVIAFLLGLWLFSEPFRWNRLLGSLVLVVGVTVVSCSGNRVEGKRA